MYRGINCKKTNNILDDYIYIFYTNYGLFIVRDEQVLANVPLVLSGCI